VRFWLLAASALAIACAASPPTGPPLPEGRVIYRFESLEGPPLSMTTLRGRPVLLTVISTWADPAMVEVPVYKRLHERYGERLTVVCVVLDDNPGMARIFRDTFAIPYQVVTVADPPGFTGPGGPLGPIGSIPTSVLIDAEGRIVARMDGMWDPDLLDRAISTLLPAN
jgi:hypothetical protein